MGHLPRTDYSTGAAAAIQTGVLRQGHYAAKFTTPASGERVRSQIYASQATVDGYDGHENWYAWSTMIAPGSALRSDGWNNLTSWHQTGPTCPAPMHLAVAGSTKMLYFATRGGPLDETTCLNPYRESWDLGTVTFGQWYDFIVHVKYSADPAVGFLEIFMNGKLVVPKTHTATLYTGQGVYLKQGYDAGSATGTTTVYNDGTVMAGELRRRDHGLPGRHLARRRRAGARTGTSALPPPTITGVPQVGNVADGDVDTSRLSPAPISYRLPVAAVRRRGRLVRRRAPRRPSNHYTIPSTDVGSRLRVRATVTTESGIVLLDLGPTSQVQDGAVAALSTSSSTLAEGATLSGVSLKWTASPSGTATKVDFYVDGAAQSTENLAPTSTTATRASSSTRGRCRTGPRLRRHRAAPGRLDRDKHGNRRHPEQSTTPRHSPSPRASAAGRR